MAGLFLVAVLIGLFMARRALAGVAEISRTARYISGSAPGQTCARETPGR